jgi:transcriptional regulator with XRE-family HTH domain
VIHRHLEIDPRTPVEAIPAAALADLLERGDLDDWRPIAAAVARDPDGELAERVLRIVDAFPVYGTSALWRAWIDRCRAREEGRRASPREATTLQGLRSDLGLTQAEVAARASMSQSDLSKFERRADVRMSRLRAVAQALGGSLRVGVELSGRIVEIRLPEATAERIGSRTAPPRRRRAAGRPARSASPPSRRRGGSRPARRP